MTRYKHGSMMMVKHCKRMQKSVKNLIKIDLNLNGNHKFDGMKIKTQIS